MTRDGLCLFATKEPRDQHNHAVLYHMNSKEDHPVAFCKSVTSKRGNLVRMIGHYDDDRTPMQTLLTKESKYNSQDGMPILRGGYIIEQ